MVSLYTIEILNEDGSYQEDEFSKFWGKMTLDSRDEKQLDETHTILNDILDNTGAKENMFRREGIAEAIPNAKYRYMDSDGETHFGQRLYCIRVSDEVLILLNGCSKTSQNPLHCKNCSQPYEFAQEFAQSFYDSYRVKKDIEVNGREIAYDEGFTLKILQ